MISCGFRLLKRASSTSRVITGAAKLDATVKANMLKNAMSLFMHTDSVEHILARLALLFDGREEPSLGDLGALKFVFQTLGIPFNEQQLGNDVCKIASCFFGAYGAFTFFNLVHLY
jgi:hypothetical protein